MSYCNQLFLSKISMALEEEKKMHTVHVLHINDSYDNDIFLYKHDNRPIC